jgi:protein gp37
MPIAQLAERGSDVAPMLPLVAPPQGWTVTGLNLPPNLPEDEWWDIGLTLNDAARSTQWCYGDWWAYGEHNYGDLTERLKPENGWTGPDYNQCRKAAVVCRAFGGEDRSEMFRRRNILSFQHHAEVAALNPSDADRLLAWCEETSPVRGVHELRAEAKPLPRRKKPPPAVSPDDHVSLERWNKLGRAAQAMLLEPDPDRPGSTSYIKQSGPDIEWAQWSLNPITGCEHTCSYCYAREIASKWTTSSVYPFGFAPTLHPRRLLAPRNMLVPPEAETDTRYKNVFLGSMADMFGRWVPKAWIDRVLRMTVEAPEWNFLCLTKFPKRLAEFDIPTNAWMGTTVDLQARVAAAEEAFANVSAQVRWLSCEPLIEPLRFKNLDRFNWIVIGGATYTRQPDGTRTPDWFPPFEWIADLVSQARDAGVAIYMKTNLGIRNRIVEMPWGAPIQADLAEAPKVFHYLGGRK